MLFGSSCGVLGRLAENAWLVHRIVARLDFGAFAHACLAKSLFLGRNSLVLEVGAHVDGPLVELELIMLLLGYAALPFLVLAKVLLGWALNRKFVTIADAWHALHQDATFLALTEARVWA